MNYDEVIDRVKLEFNESSKNILSRVTVDLVSPPIKIKGFTIRESENGIFASSPAYPSKNRFTPLIWMPKEMWDMLCGKIISEFQNANKTSNSNGDEINVEEIPF